MPSESAWRRESNVFTAVCCLIGRWRICDSMYQRITRLLILKIPAVLLFFLSCLFVFGSNCGDTNSTNVWSNVCAKEERKEEKEQMRDSREEPLKGVGTSSRGLVCWLVCWLVGCAGPWLRCWDQGRRGVVTGTLIKIFIFVFAIVFVFKIPG